MTDQAIAAAIDQKVIAELRRLFQDANEAQVFLNDLIVIFRESAAETLAAMDATLAKEDLATLAKHAHRLKGIGRNIGATRLGKACAELEVTAQQAPRPAVEELCRKINQEFQASSSELTNLYYRGA